MINKMFASDNNAGVHEKVLESIIEANKGHVHAYGDDEHTYKAINKFKELLGEDIDVYFVSNGTGSNVLALSAVTKSYNSIICANTAHINVDECGAPEKFTGCKLVQIQTDNGKIKPEDIKKHLHVLGVEHHSQPRVISITQVTELGTVYTIDEIKQLSTFAHENGMYLHMDGARIANACAYLNVSMKSMITDAGVDILSYGGIKNGIMFGEAVIFLNKELGSDFKYIRKNGMQLNSKMRYISAQYLALLTDDLWLENAKHSNKMAITLYNKVRDIENIHIIQNVESNAIFAKIPRNIIEKLQDKYYFYVWDEEKDVVRWVTSFDTTVDDVDNFVNELIKLIKESID